MTKPDESSSFAESLDRILKGVSFGVSDAGARREDGWEVDDDAGSGEPVLDDTRELSDVQERVDELGSDLDDEQYELPEIVSATEAAERAVESAPTLPEAAHPAVPITVPMAPTAVPTTIQPAEPATPWGSAMRPRPVADRPPDLRRPGRRPRVRRVTRVVRHIDPWSTFKVALVFCFVGYIVILTSGVLLWRVADSTGTIDNVERWFTQFGWETFELKGGEIYHNAWIIGLFAAFGMTGVAVLMATLFNLVSDIVGGVRVTVLEEEVVERTASAAARRYVVRRPPTGASTAATADWSVDGDDVPASKPAEATAPHQPATASAPAVTVTAAIGDWSVDDEPTT